MNELDELAVSVEADVAKDNLLEIIAEQGDKIIESFTEMMPGLSVIFKLNNAYKSVQNYFLIEKIIIFLTGLSSMTTKQRKNLIEKINNDPIHGQQFGKFLIISIDRLDFAEKSTYLARVCKFYERGDISKSLLIIE
jgi:hypothetical protein